jgi:Polyketide cyclase / dehydrase and lipid transport
VITVSMATVIEAARERVWRALARREDLCRWNPRFLRLEPPMRCVESRGTTRWRFLLGSIPVSLRIRPVEVIPGSRLRSDIRLGLFRVAATCTLHDEPGDCARTHVSLRLATANAVPLVGSALDRFDVRKLVTQLADETLRALRTWCEQPVAAAPADGSAAAPPRARPLRYAAPRAPSARDPRSADA